MRYALKYFCLYCASRAIYSSVRGRCRNCGIAQVPPANENHFAHGVMMGIPVGVLLFFAAVIWYAAR